MAEIYSAVSTILYIMAALFAAAAAVMYVRFDIRGYLAMVKNNRGGPGFLQDMPHRQRKKKDKDDTAKENRIVPKKEEDADEEGSSSTQRLDKMEGPGPAGLRDGTTNLQDGSDDTMLLKKEAIKQEKSEKDGSEPWDGPCGKFRITASTLIIHTDQYIDSYL